MFQKTTKDVRIRPLFQLTRSHPTELRVAADRVPITRQRYPGQRLRWIQCVHIRLRTNRSVAYSEAIYYKKIILSEDEPRCLIAAPQVYLFQHYKVQRSIVVQLMISQGNYLINSVKQTV